MKKFLGTILLGLIILLNTTSPVHATSYSYTASLDYRGIYSSSYNGFLGGAAGTYLNGDVYKTVGIVNLSGMPADAVITGGSLNFSSSGGCTTSDNYLIGIFRTISPYMINHTFSGWVQAGDDLQYSTTPIGVAGIFDGVFSLSPDELNNLYHNNRGFIVRSLDNTPGHYCPIQLGSITIQYDAPPVESITPTTQSFYWQTACGYSVVGADCLYDPQMGSYDGNISIATLIPDWTNLPQNLISATLEFNYSPTISLSAPYVYVGSEPHGTDIATQALASGVNTVPLSVTALRSASHIYITEAGYRTVGSLTPYIPLQNYKITLTYVSSPLDPNQTVVTVLGTDGSPQSGLSVYAFDGTTYTGYSKSTNASGQATFTLPQGNYRFRVDKNGTQFWSGAANHCAVPGCTSVNATVTLPVTITVLGTDGSPQSGLSVYAFDGTTYTGYSKSTNASGQATFTLPQGNYRFRVDKNGTQFWSGAANHCAVPGCTSVNATVTLPVTITVLGTDGSPQSGLSVYAFDGTTYTGYSKSTNASGQATFTLPQGNYRFRVDKNGTQFWSGVSNHCAIPSCTSVNATVTLPVTITVLGTDGSPQSGLSVYAFDGTTYTGYSKSTNASGQATFTLPQGNYRFRVDKNGTQFWSGVSNHCAVPGCTSVNATVTLPVTITVLGTDGSPQSGLSVYAFDVTTYTGYSKSTNASGQATFTLPQGNYRFRVDKNGTQFWSGAANHCAVPDCISVNVSITNN